MTILLMAVPAQAAPSSQTLSFSARLKNSSGGVVADGYYNIGFRLYSVETGSTPVWTEIYHDANGPAAGQDNRIKVANGYFSVKLGSLEQFTDVDWNGDLYLTMNIGGTAQVADTDSISWDGEMTPRIQLSAMPYAMNSQMLDGKTADQFLQVGSGVQDIGNHASIAINKTGSGDLMQFQSSGVNAFTLHDTGSISLGSLADQTISVAGSTTGAGRNLTLAAGDATSGNNSGGNLVLQAGSGSGTGSDGTIVMDSNITVGAGQTITMVGGATSLRPVDPDEGTIYYDSETKELLVYADDKWQVLNGGNVDGKTSTMIVAASNSPQAIKDTAKYVADGISDQDEINAALAEASGGRVYLAEGLFVIDGSISVPDDTTLVGAGSGSTIKLRDGVNTHINMLANANSTNARGVTLKDFKIDGNKANQSSGTQRGVYFNNMGTVGREGGVISGVSIYSMRTDGIYLNSSFYNMINDSYAMSNNGHGIMMFHSHSNSVTNNITRGNATGIRASNSDRNTISTNNVISNSTNGIYISGSDDNIISNNNVQDNGAGSDNNGIYLSDADNNTISGNNISDTQHTTSNYAINIFNSTADNNYISDNLLNGGQINDDGTGTRYSSQLDGNGKLINRSSGGFGVQTSAGSDAMTIDATTGDIAVAGTLEAGSIETAAVDTSSAGTLALGANNATSVTIGTSDTDGTLLVLDTKTSSGDPTGVNGAMYYNSDAGKFRCYQSGEWIDCVTPLPVSKVLTGGGGGGTFGSPGDVTGLEFDLAANTKYQYRFILTQESYDETSMASFGVTIPTGTTMNTWCVANNSVVSNYVGPVGSSPDAYCGVGDATVSMAEQATGTNYVSTMEGYIETGSNPGKLQLRMQTFGLGYVELGDNSYGILQIVQ